MKKDGKAIAKLKTKEELLEQMNYYLDLQIEIAKDKEKNYRRVESDGMDDEDKKHKNPYQNELNNQIDAIIRTCGALIRINSSALEEDEEDTNIKTKDELVD